MTRKVIIGRANVRAKWDGVCGATILGTFHRGNSILVPSLLWLGGKWFITLAFLVKGPTVLTKDVCNLLYIFKTYIEKPFEVAHSLKNEPTK
jgi:hypothetical protein